MIAASYQYTILFDAWKPLRLFGALIMHVIQHHEREAEEEGNGDAGMMDGDNEDAYNGDLEYLAQIPAKTTRRHQRAAAVTGNEKGESKLLRWMVWNAATKSIKPSRVDGGLGWREALL